MNDINDVEKKIQITGLWIEIAELRAQISVLGAIISDKFDIPVKELKDYFKKTEDDPEFQKQYQLNDLRESLDILMKVKEESDRFKKASMNFFTGKATEEDGEIIDKAIKEFLDEKKNNFFTRKTAENEDKLDEGEKKQDNE